MTQSLDLDPNETVALEVVREAPAEVELGTLRATTPQGLVTAATLAADALAPVIRDRKLFSTIQGREHVKVEGWLTLATMMGCTPREVSCDRQEDGSYVAVVELVRMRDGAVLSRASAECGGPEEGMWQARAPYARRSMATTRATSKACRIAFSWVMALAGFDTTPAEEMDGVQPAPRQNAKHGAARTGGGDHGASARTISPKQLDRLYAKAGDAEKRCESTREVMAAACHRWLADHGLESSKDLTKQPYESLCKWLDELTAERLSNFLDTTQDTEGAAAFD